MTKRWLPADVVTNTLSSKPLLDFNQTLLIVDNSPFNFSVLLEDLADYGFKIIVARDCDIGLKMAKIIQPNMILLDVMMLGIDGLEICRRLKADEDTFDIPVIFMTEGSAEVKVKEFDVRGVFYVTKPIQHEEVLDLVITQILQDLIRKLQKHNKELSEFNQMLEQFMKTRKVCCRLQAPCSNQGNTNVT
jgi:CheY-like chemotaxis protein